MKFSHLSQVTFAQVPQNNETVVQQSGEAKNETTVHKFGEKELSMCATANTDLDNITDMEKYFMSDALLDKLNASIILAMANATEQTKTNCNVLQDKLSAMNEAADTVNYDYVDKMKTMTDEKITADDDCLNELKRLNETNQLGLIPVSVAFKAKNITDSYMQATNQLYQAFKLKVAPKIESINQGVDALAEELKVNANGSGPKIDALIVDITETAAKLKDSAQDQSDYIEKAKVLADDAQKQFKELDQIIKSFVPQLTV